MITSTIMKMKNMKELNTFQAKTENKNNKISTVFATLIIFLAAQSACAQTASKNIDVFIGVQYGLTLIIPIAAAIIFLFLLLIYVFRIISRVTFVRWTFSVIIAGAAFYISSILFHIT
ncbi:hypothetical protein Q648_01018 [Bartonella quintana JK 12]|nr:hypothetical protein Q648_01018 [Bartonella quintana JK 12]ETS19152.1 hypothetical protein Q647_00160 [Bartonella quintana JK 7]